jgi:hypothetical protein
VKYLQLQTNGHEIASHTLNNTNYATFIAGGGTDQQYIDQEIIADITAKEADGVNKVETYGPTGYNNPIAMNDKIFAGTQIKNIPNTDFGNYDNLNYVRNCYNQAYKRTGNKMIFKMGSYLDVNTIGYDVNYIDSLLTWARDNNEIIIINGHEIAEGASGLQVDLDYLESICSFVYNNGMSFYTVKELNQIVTKSNLPTKPYLGTFSFSGTLEVGEEVVMNLANDNDETGTILLKKFQWWRADDADGLNKVEILGANLATGHYVLAAGDNGKYIRGGCRLSVGNDIGFWSYTKWLGPIAP